MFLPRCRQKDGKLCIDDDFHCHRQLCFFIDVYVIISCTCFNDRYRCLFFDWLDQFCSASRDQHILSILSIALTVLQFRVKYHRQTGWRKEIRSTDQYLLQ